MRSQRFIAILKSQVEAIVNAVYFRPKAGVAGSNPAGGTPRMGTGEMSGMASSLF